MDRVRLIALALAVCGACRRAEAVPPATQPPAGWQPLADVAAAASDAAKGDGLTVDASTAWGDTARGCYALAITVHGASGSLDAIHKDLVAALGSAHDLAAGSDALAIAFERAGYHGKLRARSGDAGVDALACFWNDREPESCAAACDGWLQ